MRLSRYKLKSSTSFVDQTLFKTVREKVIHISTVPLLNSALQDSTKKEKQISDNAVIVSSDALKEMLRPSPILSFEEQRALKQEKEKRIEESRVRARERRTRMQQVHLSQALLTDSDRHERRSADGRRAKEISSRVGNRNAQRGTRQGCVRDISIIWRQRENRFVDV